MAASYPGAIKTFTDKVNLADTIDAADINDAYAEIEAVENELGINPAGAFATVVLALAESAGEKVTTKGDLVVGDGANSTVRLAVGTNSQVLTADSAEASGMKWGSGGGGGASIIETQVFT